MSTLILSRRTLLLGSAAAAMAPMLPATTTAEPTIVGIDLAKGPDTMMWVIGTPGEYDWQAINASSVEEAFSEYLAAWGYERDALGDIHEYVQRVEKLDGRDPDSLTGADWLSIGMGYCCEECGTETSADSGAVVVDGTLYCESCLTFERRLVADPDSVVEDLANDIYCNGADETKADLEDRGDWTNLPAELWARAIAEAAKP
jgi:hypothetical protein